MLSPHYLEPQHFPRLQALYSQGFFPVAASAYSWSQGAPYFETLCLLLASGELQGLWLEDTLSGEAVGLLLYKLESHAAIEVNLLYLDPKVPQKQALDALMPFTLKHWCTLPHWQVVSFAMLGQQTQLIQTLTWYGFKPVGQAIVVLTLTETLSLAVMQKQAHTWHAPEGMAYVPYAPQHKAAVAQVLHEAFHTQSDALWDPRFASLEGAMTLLDLLESGRVGEFYPKASVLLQEQATGAIVGFALLCQEGVVRGNIPLIAVRPLAHYRNQGLGKKLLGTLVKGTIEGLMDGSLPIVELSATVCTEQLAAIKMYRSGGFVEVDNYAHAYLPRAKAEAFTPGVWC